LTEDIALGTWESLQKEHSEIFAKVNLLEKALLDLVQKRTTGHSEGTSNMQTDFLEAFQKGITLHFTVEEIALFPVMKRKGTNAETLVDELLFQHQSIMEKHNRIMQAYTDEEKRETLLRLAQELAEHTHKEDVSIPSVVAQMSPEQLREIDQTAKHLGYNL
jgi:hemerythrin-like domain-containing protein